MRVVLGEEKLHHRAIAHRERATDDTRLANTSLRRSKRVRHQDILQDSKRHQTEERHLRRREREHKSSVNA